MDKMIEDKDKKIYLFLDDIREPHEVYDYTQHTIFIEKDWEIVRNYVQFTQFILDNGLPEFISFDHDLADTHYLDDKTRLYITNKTDDLIPSEKTGMDCAKWLVDFCLTHDLKCPSFYCHSMNPVGRENINGILNNFKKHYDN